MCQPGQSPEVCRENVIVLNLLLRTEICHPRCKFLSLDVKWCILNHVKTIILVYALVPNAIAIRAFWILRQRNQNDLDRTLPPAADHESGRTMIPAPPSPLPPFPSPTSDLHLRYYRNSKGWGVVRLICSILKLTHPILFFFSLWQPKILIYWTWGKTRYWTW